MNSISLPTSETLRAIDRAAHRFNATLEYQPEIAAIDRTAQVYGKPAWEASSLGPTLELYEDGIVRLAQRAESSAVVAPFIGTIKKRALCVKYSTITVPQRFVLDYWPDRNPGTAGSVEGADWPAGLTIHSLDLYVGRRGAAESNGRTWTGSLMIQPWLHTGTWQRTKWGSPIAISTDVIIADGGWITVPTYNLRHSSGGVRALATGLGRAYDDTVRPITANTAVAPGFSFEIWAEGDNTHCGWLGYVNTYDPTEPSLSQSFWRSAADFDHPLNILPLFPDMKVSAAQGQYPPDSATGRHQDNTAVAADFENGALGGGKMQWGATPAFGGSHNSTGVWSGISIPSQVQSGAPGSDISRDLRVCYLSEDMWPKIGARLYITQYEPTGTAVSTLDLGSQPELPVTLSIDDRVYRGTAISYTLEGSTDGSTWTDINGGAAVQDGYVCSGDELVQHYRLTAVLSCVQRPGATGDDSAHSTPELIGWSMAEREVFAVLPYTTQIAGDNAISYANGIFTSQVDQVSLTLARIGRRSLAERLATEYAPTKLELRIYAVDSALGAASPRLLMWIGSLEDRQPGDGTETFTFLSPMWRLKAVVPDVDYVYYPTAGDGMIDAVFNDTAVSPTTWRIDVDPAYGAMPVAPSVAGFVFNGTSDNLESFQTIIETEPAPTATRFWITLPEGVGAPQVGGTFNLRSQTQQRSAVTYSGIEMHDVYASVLELAGIPERYIGAQPPETTELGSLVVDGKGEEAMKIIEPVAAANGLGDSMGAIVCRRGKIDWVDILGPKTAVAVWDENEIVSLSTPTGSSKRHVAIRMKMDYDHGTQKFASEVVTVDNALQTLLGRPNLYDIINVSEDLGKIVSSDRARAIVARLQRAFGRGVMLWTVKTAHQWPTTDIGDAVSVLTEEYTDRRWATDADGTDMSTPIAGRVSVLGVIVGHNLQRDEFTILVRGAEDITGAINGTGSMGGSGGAVAAVDDFEALAEYIENDSGVVASIVTTYTPPQTPYFASVIYKVAVVSGSSVGASYIVQGGKDGNDLIPAVLGTTYHITPISVAVSGLQTEGQPVTVSVAGVGVPRMTIGTPEPSSTKIALPITDWGTSQYADVYVDFSFTDPGSTYDDPSTYARQGRAPTTTVRRDSNADSILLPILTPTTWLVVSVVPRNALGHTGASILIKTQGSGAVAPVAPGTVTNTAIADSPTYGVLVTNDVTITDATAAVRCYVNGRRFGPDHFVGGFGSLGTATIQHSLTRGADDFIDPAYAGQTLEVGQTYRWQYTHVTSTGLESALSAAINVTISLGTVQSISITGQRFADWISMKLGHAKIEVTAPNGLPPNVTFEVETQEVGGSAGWVPNRVAQNRKFMVGNLQKGSNYVIRVRATVPGFTPSLWSNNVTV